MLSSFWPYTYFYNKPATHKLIARFGVAAIGDVPYALLKEGQTEDGGATEGKLQKITYDSPVLPSHDWSGSVELIRRLVGILGPDRVTCCLDLDAVREQGEYCAICLGSNVSNLLSRQILMSSDNRTGLRIIGNAGAIGFSSSPESGKITHQWPTDRKDGQRNDYGLLLRMPWRGRHALVLAGIGGGATEGLARFLVGQKCLQMFNMEEVCSSSTLGLVAAFRRGEPGQAKPVAKLVDGRFELLG
ncbi:hypothetical protein ACFLSJ_00930 [Verrucomicrobiota bacterium]